MVATDLYSRKKVWKRLCTRYSFSRNETRREFFTEGTSKQLEDSFLCGKILLGTNFVNSSKLGKGRNPLLSSLEGHDLRSRQVSNRWCCCSFDESKGNEVPSEEEAGVVVVVPLHTRGVTPPSLQQLCCFQISSASSAPKRKGFPP